jgi:hypothetical protein
VTTSRWFEVEPGVGDRFADSENETYPERDKEKAKNDYEERERFHFNFPSCHLKKLQSGTLMQRNKNL